GGVFVWGVGRRGAGGGEAPCLWVWGASAPATAGLDTPYQSQKLLDRLAFGAQFDRAAVLRLVPRVEVHAHHGVDRRGDVGGADWVVGHVLGKRVRRADHLPDL